MQYLVMTINVDYTCATKVLEPIDQNNLIKYEDSR